MAEVVAGRGDWSNVTTVVCDLDGVVYIEGSAVPGAGEALAELRADGRRVLFATNNSMKTPRSVVEALHDVAGYDADEADVVTSGLVTAMALAGLARTVLVVGAPPLVETLRSHGFSVVTDWREADAVVCGMNFSLTYDDLAAATLAIRAGALFYATNTDATYPTAEGQKPGGGAIVAALRTASGVDPVVCGKPHPPVGAAVRALAATGDILVVGDRYETDIALGKAEGWATALVLSGVTEQSREVPAGLEPDVVVPSLVDLPALLA